MLQYHLPNGLTENYHFLRALTNKKPLVMREEVNSVVPHLVLVAFRRVLL